MLDRIVPVHRTDLLSLYFLILKNSGITQTAATLPIKAVSPGVFDISSITDTQYRFLAEPVKKIITQAAPTWGQMYFVPAFDFEGLEDPDGNKLELYVPEGLENDGKTFCALTFNEEDGFEVNPNLSLDWRLNFDI